MEDSTNNTVYKSKTGFTGQKYYFNVKIDETMSDDNIIAKHPEIDSIYTVYQANMSNSTVKFKDYDKNYSVYDQQGKSLGMSESKDLPLATKYLDDLQVERTRHIWANPIWQKGTRRADGGMSNKNDERFTGLAFGFAETRGTTTLAASISYLDGSVKNSTGYKSESDSFGLMLGGRTELKGDKWLEYSISYQHQKADQTRIGFGGIKESASPKTDIFGVGVGIGKEVGRSNLVAGLDYAFVGTGTYTESSIGGAGLDNKINPDSFNSLRLRLGISHDFVKKDKFALTGHATYRFEMLDDKGGLRYTFAGTNVGGYFEGAKQNRSSGSLGMLLDWDLNEQHSLSFGYDLNLGDKYTGHNLSLNYTYKF